VPLEGFPEVLANVVESEENSGGLRVGVRILPDYYRYEMASGCGDLVRAGYRGAELEQKVKALHTKRRGDRGKVLVELSMSSVESQTYYFFQTEIKDAALKVEWPRKKGYELLGTEPKPRFTNWTVFEQPSGKRQARFQKALAQFDKLTCRFAVSAPKDPKAPLVVSMGNIARVKDSIGPGWYGPEIDYRIKERINTQTKQIQTADWSGQTIAPVSLRFLPGEWPREDCPAFERLLVWLEMNVKP
jgi:hypothetical protein